MRSGRSVGREDGRGELWRRLKWRAEGRRGAGEGEDGSWAFPERAWQPPERARDGLRELIAESCGDALDAHQVGNAPVAHLERDADSVFFWRFQYVQGEMKPQEGTQHAWLTKDELSERLGGPLGELATKMCGPMS